MGVVEFAAFDALNSGTIGRGWVWQIRFRSVRNSSQKMKGRGRVGWSFRILCVSEVSCFGNLDIRKQSVSK